MTKIHDEDSEPIAGDPSVPEPQYHSFAEFQENVPKAIVRNWCQQKARNANRFRLMSGEPHLKITPEDILGLLLRAEGRCYYCGSLCVEKSPHLGRKPMPWGLVGRRIGSIEHLKGRASGGDNDLDNLRWCCLWCNTWKTERIPGATDHGAIQCSGPCDN